MAELHARTGAPLLLDLGHLVAYQRSRGLEETAALDGFPLEEVVEVHLAGGVVTEGPGGRAFYVDDHTQPVREELFHLLELCLPRLKKLRALTFEGDGHPEAIALKTLARLRKMLPPVPVHPVSVHPEPVEGSASPVPMSSNPWALFDERHGRAPPREDESGTRAELDFRLAVIAESLDRTFPLSRLLLLGTREALIGFTSSEAYRAVFGAPGGGEGFTLESAYVRHAREVVRGLGEESFAGVLAFEQWAHGLFERPAPEGLSAELREGTFALDLSEVVFATRAVRRHLGQRAWASGRLELSGLESLRQVARRAEPGRWKALLRREGLTLTVSSERGPA
jgi:hypothetical protein